MVKRWWKDSFAKPPPTWNDAPEAPRCCPPVAPWNSGRAARCGRSDLRERRSRSHRGKKRARAARLPWKSRAPRGHSGPTEPGRGAGRRRDEASLNRCPAKLGQQRFPNGPPINRTGATAGGTRAAPRPGPRPRLSAPAGAQPSGIWPGETWPADAWFGKRTAQPARYWTYLRRNDTCLARRPVHRPVGRTPFARRKLPS